MNEIRYPYAYDENDRLTHIDEVSPESRHEHRYHCPACNSEMIARLGNRNEHHFAHRGDDNTVGHNESYLHRVAKDIIVERFNSGLFPIRRRIQEVCSNKCEEFDAKCRNGKEVNINLAKIYDLPPKVEKSLYEDGFYSFIPDVTFLCSSPLHNPIWIEIYHTHPCSDKKINSGNKIIEIKVTDNSELEYLKTAVFCEYAIYNNSKSYKVDFLNFEQQISVPSSNFFDNHPYCTWTQYEIKEYKEEKQRDIIQYELENSEWTRLYWYKSNKYFCKKILEKDLLFHHEASLFELTMQYTGRVNKGILNYLLERAVEIFPHLKTCQRCHNYSKNFWGTEWCNIRKNGSSRKGTFNPNKAPNCKYYSNVLDTSPAIYLWIENWPNNSFSKHQHGKFIKENNLELVDQKTGEIFPIIFPFSSNER